MIISLLIKILIVMLLLMTMMMMMSLMMMMTTTTTTTTTMADDDHDNRELKQRQGNETGKKAIGLDWQKNNFARVSRFFVHFLAVIARLQRVSA